MCGQPIEKADELVSIGASMKSQKGTKQIQIFVVECCTGDFNCLIRLVQFGC